MPPIRKLAEEAAEPTKGEGKAKEAMGDGEPEEEAEAPKLKPDALEEEAGPLAAGMKEKGAGEGAEEEVEMKVVNVVLRGSSYT